MDASEKYHLGASEPIECPECKTVLANHDIKNSAWFACRHCRTYFRYSNDDETPVKISQYNKSAERKPELNLGDEGVLLNKKVIVTGFIRKSYTFSSFHWEEYMLYSPEEDGYYVLADTGEEWYFIWKSDRSDFKVMNTNVMMDSYVAIQQNPYRKYDHLESYRFKIVYATGEFDYNIMADSESLLVNEYEGEGRLLVSEEKDDKIDWYKGLRVTNSDIRKAFNKEPTTRLKKTFEDVYTTQWTAVRNFSLAMVAIVLLTQLLFTKLKPEKSLLSQTYVGTIDNTSWSTGSAINAGEITVDGPAALNFNIGANVSNEWLEVTVNMVNTSTGKNYEFTKLIEYYSGYDSDGNWSEGSTSADALLSGVPSGVYKLNMYPSSASVKNFYITLDVQQNTTLFSNLWLILLLIISYPAYLMIRIHYYYENK